MRGLTHTGDEGLIPGSGRSSGGGNGHPLHCSCLGNPMDRGAWRTTVFIMKQQHGAEFEYEPELYSQGIFSCNHSLQPSGVHIRLVQWLYGDVNSGDMVERETGGVFVDAKPVQFQPYSSWSSLVPQGADRFQISFPASQNHVTSS